MWKTLRKHFIPQGKTELRNKFVILCEVYNNGSDEQFKPKRSKDENL